MRGAAGVGVAVGTVVAAFGVPIIVVGVVLVWLLATVSPVVVFGDVLVVWNGLAGVLSVLAVVVGAVVSDARVIMSGVVIMVLSSAVLEDATLSVSSIFASLVVNTVALTNMEVVSDSFCDVLSETRLNSSIA